MATYAQTILPSGRALRVEKLPTKTFRVVLDQAANKSQTELMHQMLLYSFRGITPDPVPWIEKDLEPAKEGDKPTKVPDVDAMLASVPETGWIIPTHEDMIVKDGPKSLDKLLEDATDYLAALGAVGAVMFPNRGRVEALSGKLVTAYVER